MLCFRLELKSRELRVCRVSKDTAVKWLIYTSLIKRMIGELSGLNENKH